MKILDCGTDPIPTTADPRITQFGSLNDLCGGYPNGVGYYCRDVDGRMDAHGRPPGLLWRITLEEENGSEELRRLCFRKCRCFNLAPDEPDRAQNRAPIEECAADGEDPIPSSVERSRPTQTAATAQCSSSGHASQGEGYMQDAHCNEARFGRPSSEDCKSAIARLPDHQEFMEMAGEPEYMRHREFLGIGATPIPGRDTIQTPFILTNGTSETDYK